MPGRRGPARRGRRPWPTRRAPPSARTTGPPGTVRSASCCGRNGPGRSRDLRSPRPGRRPPDRPPRSCGPPATVWPLYGPACWLSVPSGLRMLIIGQVTPLADVVVIGIVRGGDFHAAAAQFRLGPRVGDQRDLAFEQRQQQLAAVQRHVAQLLELREHVALPPLRLPPAVRPGPPFLWPAPPPAAAAVPLRRGPTPWPDRDARPRPCRPAWSRAASWQSSRGSARPAADRSPDSGMCQKCPLHRFVKHLVVADRRLQERVPVHQPFAAEDPLLLEQVEERAADRAAHVSSSVKRRRCQSQLQPIDLSCWMMRVS